tara:strand:- start:7325 stop:7534 length:210 start_codon:yes stop_codon:yes gene_type:complete
MSFTNISNLQSPIIYGLYFDQQANKRVFLIHLDFFFAAHYLINGKILNLKYCFASTKKHLFNMILFDWY